MDNSNSYIDLPAMFPRGNGSLVSILISSRGRAQTLRENILATCRNTQNIDNIEFVVKVDEDDKETQEILRTLPNGIHISVVETERGEGFVEMAKWVDLMCQKATGDWLLLLNDDAYVASHGWDVIISEGGIKVPRIGFEHLTLLLFEEEGKFNSFSFPCLRKSVFGILGHFSPVVACDLWIGNLMTILQKQLRIPINVKHDRSKHEGDETRKEVVAANSLYTWQLTGVHSLNQLAADLIAPTRWLTKYESGLSWQEEKPTEDGYYWWRAVDGGPEHLVYVTNDFGLWMPRLVDGVISSSDLKDIDGQWARMQHCTVEKNITDPIGWPCPNCYGHGFLVKYGAKVYADKEYKFGDIKQEKCKVCYGKKRVKLCEV